MYCDTAKRERSILEYGESQPSVLTAIMEIYKNVRAVVTENAIEAGPGKVLSSPHIGP